MYLDVPSVRYRYVPGAEVASGGRISWVDTLLLDAPEAADDADGAYFVSRRFLDGKGRALYTKLEGGARPDGPPGTVIRGVASFTTRGATFEALTPCAARPQADPFGWENPFDPAWRCEWLIDGTWRWYGFAEAPKSSRTYDAFDREIETRLPDGEVRRIRYRPLERRMEDEKAVRGAASALTYQYDGLDRLAAMIEEPHLDTQGLTTGTRQTWRTTYGYDAADRLVSIRNSEEVERTASYDLLGRVVKIESPALGRRDFVYDAASRLVRRWDGAGRETTFEYDGAGRLRLVHTTLRAEGGLGASSSPSLVRYTYDLARPGHLARVEDRLGTEELSYDARGRVTRMQRRLASDLGGAVLTLVEAFDAMDRPILRTFPDGDRLRFHYDERSQLSSLVLDSVGVIAAGATYAPDEQLVAVELGNGLTRAHAYDRRGRLSRTWIEARRASVPLFSERLSFDTSSNMVERARTRSAARQVDTFGYDELHRLVSATMSRPTDSFVRRADYRYSAAGDLVALHHDGIAVPVEFMRDVSGRVVRTAQSELTWNSDGDLQSVRHAGLRLDNLYDGSGRRGWSRLVDETSDAVVETRLWPWPGYEMRNGRVIKKVKAFGGLLASIGVVALERGRTSGGVSYYHTDHLGSPVMRFDDDGQVLGQRSYGVYGRVLGEQGFGGVSEGFAGASYEGAFGLSVFEARAMADVTGRFLSPDPALLHMAAPPLSPQALNPFSYSTNRPLTHIDPDGRVVSALITAGIATIDTYQYWVGNLSTSEYATAMTLNGAALVADVVTLGTGGGLAIRAGNLAVKGARAIARAEAGYSVLNATFHGAYAAGQGRFGEAVVYGGLAAAGARRHIAAKGTTVFRVSNATVEESGSLVRNSVRGYEGRYWTTVDPERVSRSRFADWLGLPRNNTASRITVGELTRPQPIAPAQGLDGNRGGWAQIEFTDSPWKSELMDNIVEYPRQ